MEHDHLISGLTRKRGELTGQIDALVSQIAAITDDVRAIDQVMLLYRPDMRPEAIPAIAYRPRDDWAQRGEVQRAILTVMRAADGPMACADITRAVMAAREVDPGLFPLHRKRMSRTLDKLRSRGMVVSQRQGGRGELRWEIVR